MNLLKRISRIKHKRCYFQGLCGHSTSRRQKIAVGAEKSSYTVKKFKFLDLAFSLCSANTIYKRSEKEVDRQFLVLTKNTFKILSHCYSKA